MNIVDQKKAAIESCLIKTAEIIGKIRQKFGYTWYARVLVYQTKMATVGHVGLIISDTSHMR